MSAQQIISKLDKLKPLRLEHESTWRECFDLTYPLRGSGFNGDTLTAKDGDNRKAKQMDSTATDSVRVLASSMQSGVTPSNSIWFGLDAGDESDEEKMWLADAAEAVWENIHQANFDSVSYEGNVDIVCAGWFAMYIAEDQDRGGYMFELWPISQVYCEASKASGMIDTVYREYTLTAIQAFNQFGNNVSEGIKKAMEPAANNADKEFKFLHAIYPRSVTEPNSKLAKNMPIASMHVEIESKFLNRESGYEEMPVVVPRWMLIPGTAYAVGAVYDALADIRELNALKALDKSASEMSIAGMWIATDDGVLNPRSIKVGARRVIIANSVDSMKELKSSGNWQLATERITELKMSIRKILMADHLQPQDGPVITATEANINVGLIRQLLGPIYGRMQSEYLQPLIDRCFGLAYRAGALGQPPESLLNREFKVKYLSPLARAQKLEDVTAIERFNGNMQAVAAIYPQVLDNIDFDEQSEALAQALGVPVHTMRKKDDVAKLREDRAKAQQAAEQQAQQQAMAQSAGESIMNAAAAPA